MMASLVSLDPAKLWVLRCDDGTVPAILTACSWIGRCFRAAVSSAAESISRWKRSMAVRLDKQLGTSPAESTVLWITRLRYLVGQ